MSFYCCKCFRPKKNKIGIAKALADTSKLARLVQILKFPLYYLMSAQENPERNKNEK